MIDNTGPADAGKAMGAAADEYDAADADHEYDADREAAGTVRHIVWRAGTVGLAALDVDDADLLHGWRSDPVAAHGMGIWPRGGPPPPAARQRGGVLNHPHPQH
ncbi:hypothetical protein ACFV5G_28170, partial [Streptomyces sp. NPDC059766]